MALQLLKNQPNGLVTTYWRIVKLYLDREHFGCDIMLAPYKDKDFRLANGPSSYDEANVVSFHFSGVSMPETIQDVYDKIKTLTDEMNPEHIDWTQATDI